MSEANLAETTEAPDLANVEFWRAPDAVREAGFAWLRRETPIAFHQEFDPPPEMPLPKGPGYWSLSRHADVLLASRNAEIFSSGKGTSIPDLPPMFNEFFGSMINMDDPRHGRLRRIVSRGFTPRALATLQHDVERRAATVVDSVIDKGECDFVTEIAARMPLEIICDMVGIPDSQADMVFEHSNIILGLGDPEYVAPGENPLVAALTSGNALGELMKDVAKTRRGNPKDDLTSVLVNAEVDGDVLDEADLASFFILLVVAGNETTRNAISHGMKALCDFPEERAKWVADFDGVAPTAVEEIVRWATPVIHFRRTATRDTEIRGQKIAEGDKVVLWYNSANRDEAVFDEPFRLNLTRTPNEHVGFGGPGAHYCMGANLARREMTVMFRELFRRLSDLEISGEPEMLQSNFIHGIKRMPCTFTPGGGK